MVSLLLTLHDSLRSPVKTRLGFTRKPPTVEDWSVGRTGRRYRELEIGEMHSPSVTVARRASRTSMLPLSQAVAM